MENEIGLDARSASGKANRRLRREGIVPGVVFGLKSDSVPVQLDGREFETIYRRAGKTSVVNLKLDGQARTSQPSTVYPGMVMAPSDSDLSRSKSSSRSMSVAVPIPSQARRSTWTSCSST